MRGLCGGGEGGGGGCMKGVVGEFGDVDAGDAL